MISCSDYDYVEIVCLYNYPVEIMRKSGAIVEGKALDTKRDQNKCECIELEVQGNKCLIILEHIHHLKITQDNPHFTQVVFN